MTEVLYTKKYLIEALKAAKLPHTYVTLIRYETAGVIPIPRTPTQDGGRGVRLYTTSEIESAVQRVKEHVTRKVKK